MGFLRGTLVAHGHITQTPPPTHAGRGKRRVWFDLVDDVPAVALLVPSMGHGSLLWLSIRLAPVMGPTATFVRALARGIRDSRTSSFWITADGNVVN